MIASHRLHLACAILAGLFTASSAQATIFGLDTDPMGSAWNRGDANTGWSLWDSFPGVAGPSGPVALFSNDAPDSGSGLTNALLSQSSNGPLLTGSGDRVYSFGSSPAWTITAESAFSVKGFALQMKQYQYPGFSLEVVYAPTLNGIAADIVTTTSFTEGANTNTVTTWYWSASLAALNITNINLQIADQAANHYSVDSIAIDAGNVAVVPEPTVIPLLGGAGLFFLMRRRRATAPSVA